MEFFVAISLSLWIGVKLTIFFKKSFNFEQHVLPRLRLDGPILILLVSHTWLPQTITVAAAAASLSAIMDMFPMLQSTIAEFFKCLVLGFSVFVPWMTGDGSCILPSLSVLFATTQFLRWPQSLKDFLRDVRIIFGPAYVLVVIGAWVNCDIVSSTKLLLVAALSSYVAAIFLRPDNAEMLQWFRLPVPRPVTRKVSHAMLMFFSLACMAVHILLFQSFPWMCVKMICVVMIVLNVILFFGAAHAPRLFIAAVVNAVLRFLV